MMSAAYCPRAGLDFIDQLPLVIRLKSIDLNAKLPGQGRNPLIHIGQGRCPVDFGLTPAQHIQVRAV